MREDYYSADDSEYIPGRRQHRSGKEINYTLPFATKDLCITLKADDKSNRSFSFPELKLKKANKCAWHQNTGWICDKVGVKKLDFSQFVLCKMFVCV